MTSSNGKGDSPRNNFSHKYRENFDVINWSKNQRARTIPKPIIIDNALSDYPLLEQWIKDKAEFKTENHGGHDFHIARTSNSFNGALKSGIEKALAQDIKVNYSFLRLSTIHKDCDTRIHVDSMMDSEYAWVLYFANPPFKTPEITHGTAFFEHIKHGKHFISENNATESNRLILEDSGDINKWKLYKICEMKKNRLLVYPTKLFHSRYPFEGWGENKSNGRVVSAGFFNIQ